MHYTTKTTKTQKQKRSLRTLYALRWIKTRFRHYTDFHLAADCRLLTDSVTFWVKLGGISSPLCTDAHLELFLGRRSFVVGLDVDLPIIDCKYHAGAGKQGRRYLNSIRPCSLKMWGPSYVQKA